MINNKKVDVAETAIFCEKAELVILFAYIAHYCSSIKHKLTIYMHKYWQVWEWFFK